MAVAAAGDPVAQLDFSLPNLASLHLRYVLGDDTEAAQHSIKLVEQYAWSTRTTASCHSQWLTWIQYYADSKLAPLPVTEAHLCGFFGF